MDITSDMILYYGMNYLYSFSFGYFYSYFLNCKTPIRHTILFRFFYTIGLAPFLILFGNQFAIKEVLALGLLFVYLRIVYPNNSMIKCMIAEALHFVIMTFTDFCILIGVYFYTGRLILFEGKTEIPLVMHICELILFLILFTLCIRVFSNKIYVANKISIAQILLLINSSLVFLISSMMIFILDTATALSYYFYLFIFFLISSIVLFSIMIKENIKKQQELSILVLEKEYEKQLLDYMRFQNHEENYQKLRHDLINFMISNQKEIQP